VAVANETQALWQEYRRSGDQGLRDRLILTYAPLVKFVAGRVGASLPAHVDEQDLVSYGLLGLIGAIERYDPGREIKFETFAMARIRGAIIDELRSLDWVPRSVRTRARQIERAIAALEKELMRAPTDAEIAQKLGLTGEELEESLHEISRSSVAALDELWSPSGTGDQIALIDTIEDESGPSPELSLEQTEIKEALAEAIALLEKASHRSPDSREVAFRLGAAFGLVHGPTAIPYALDPAFDTHRHRAFPVSVGHTHS